MDCQFELDDVTYYYHLPSDQVVEISRRVVI
ncbi:Uncharacterised protein [Yersinia thracica]|uniref:Uncharacterized protein n=1 Tax=Yersinia thracica TaxID=2890319 RepID=A0A0T9PLC4_9GAMM|nr:Uncharacterised protein [Yersinia thracica]